MSIDPIVRCSELACLAIAALLAACGDPATRAATSTAPIPMSAAPPSQPSSRPASTPQAAPAAGQGNSQHWCYLRGTGADVKVAPCFESEDMCKHMFTTMATYDVIEACHYRSPVYCFDVFHGDGEPSPECYAKMSECAGHWQVVHDHPRGDKAGPGCIERAAAGAK